MQILDTAGWKEGVGLDPIAGAYALMDKPAHPNAAKVFLTGCSRAKDNWQCREIPSLLDGPIR